MKPDEGCQNGIPAKAGAKALDVTGASWVETPAIGPHASGHCNANKKLRNARDVQRLAHFSIISDIGGHLSRSTLSAATSLVASTVPQVFALSMQAE
jgi:hypothetical protein